MEERTARGEIDEKNGPACGSVRSDYNLDPRYRGWFLPRYLRSGMTCYGTRMKKYVTISGVLLGVRLLIIEYTCNINIPAAISIPSREHTNYLHYHSI